MTETEWLACDDPIPMLNFLRGKASNRKLRLLAAACCRRTGSMLVHEVLRTAIEMAELYADGQARHSEMVQAAKGVESFSYSATEIERTAANGIWYLVTMGAFWNLWPFWRTKLTIRALLAARRGVEIPFAPVFHCIFGPLPFRRIPATSPQLNSTVLALCECIYQERAFDPFPLLADALQAAGCDNDDILNHCRQPGEHVRGCWVLDLLTARK